MYKKKRFIFVFVCTLLVFALCEVLGYTLSKRKMLRAEERAVSEIEREAQYICDWLVNLNDKIEQSDSVQEVASDLKITLRDSALISVVAIIYSGAQEPFLYVRERSSIAWGYTSYEIVGQYGNDEEILSYSRGGDACLTGSAVRQFSAHITSVPEISEDINDAKRSGKSMLCGTGSYWSTSDLAGCLVAYVPITTGNEADNYIAAIVEGSFLCEFPLSGVTNEGYGYTLSKYTATGNVVISYSPDSIVGEKGKWKVHVPGQTWDLNVYPYQSFISAGRILLEVIIAVLTALFLARGRLAKDTYIKE